MFDIGLRYKTQKNINFSVANKVSQNELQTQLILAK